MDYSVDDLREIAEQIGWTPKQITACETVARTLGHDWASRDAVGVALALGWPLASGTIALANRIRWEPGCKCSAGLPVPCTVLDPFGGSGTTGYIASRNGCRAVMIELNPKYAKLAHDRCG